MLRTAVISLLLNALLSLNPHFVAAVEDERDDVVLYGTERTLSGTDRVAILQRENDEIRYNSISSGEECVLRKFVTLKPVERCETFDRRVCEKEFVLARRLVKENCTLQNEFCETTHRTQKVDSPTVLCQLEYEVECYGEYGVDHSQSGQVCHPRRAAFCKRKSKTFTTTEKKQKCNGQDHYRTTKLCVTHPSGSGSCVDLTGGDDFCDDRDEMKIISSEVIQTGGQLDCSATPSKNESAFCHPTNCHVISNRTNCVSDTTGEIFNLKETVCEKCLEERIKVRPVVEERLVCRNKKEKFCLTIDEKSVKWRKWCRSILVGGRLDASDYQAQKQDKESSGNTGNEVYHIEVSPGRWVITSNQKEAELLLKQQQDLEKQQKREANEQNPDEGLTGRIKRCSSDLTKCSFRWNDHAEK